MNSPLLSNLPSYATVTQNTLFPKKDQAVVIDAIENIQIKDYAQALGKIIDPTHIRFLSRISNNRICVYVSTKLIADDIIDNKKYLTIQNQKLPIRPLINRNKRIIISNVCPIIPHTEIEKKLKELQIKPMSSISFLRAGINETGFNHILSFRRQVYVSPEDFYRLPDKISIDFDETTYWIYFSSDTMTCFVCKKDGHVASKCPEAVTESNFTVENNDDSLITEQSTFKRPHPPTESSTTDIIESEIPKEDSSTSNENSENDTDYCQSSSDEAYTTKNGKKLKRSHQHHNKNDIDSINWQEIGTFISDSKKIYPLSGPQVKEYLKQTYGVKNITEITYSYTDQIQPLIELLQDLLPYMSCRSVKNRLTRIVSKLKILKNNPK